MKTFLKRVAKHAGRCNMQIQSSCKVHLNTISNKELSDPLWDSVNRGLTLVRLLDSLLFSVQIFVYVLPLLIITFMHNCMYILSSTFHNNFLYNIEQNGDSTSLNCITSTIPTVYNRAYAPCELRGLWKAIFIKIWKLWLSITFLLPSVIICLVFCVNGYFSTVNCKFSI